MKFKTIKYFPGVEIGTHSEFKPNGTYERYYFGSLAFSLKVISENPGWFEPISEEDEKLEEAKKLLESKGYQVTKPNIGMYATDRKTNDDVVFSMAKRKCSCVLAGVICTH